MIDPGDVVEDIAVNLAAVEGPGAKARERGHEIVGLPSGPRGHLVAPVERVFPKFLLVECRDRRRPPFAFDDLELAPILDAGALLEIGPDWVRLLLRPLK